MHPRWIEVKIGLSGSMQQSPFALSNFKEMQKVKETTDKHPVFVADSDGINTVFPMLVERLKDDRLYQRVR